MVAYSLFSDNHFKNRLDEEAGQNSTIVSESRKNSAHEHINVSNK